MRFFLHLNVVTWHEMYCENNFFLNNDFENFYYGGKNIWKIHNNPAQGRQHMCGPTGAKSQAHTGANQLKLFQLSTTNCCCWNWCTSLYHTTHRNPPLNHHPTFSHRATSFLLHSHPPLTSWRYGHRQADVQLVLIWSHKLTVNLNSKLNLQKYPFVCGQTLHIVHRTRDSFKHRKRKETKKKQMRKIN